MTHLALELKVDFERRILEGQATLTFDRGEEITAIDTRALEIEAVVTCRNEPIVFEMSEPHPVRGTTILVRVPKDKNVRILYRTSSTASGLQWLTPEQKIGRDRL